MLKATKTVKKQQNLQYFHYQDTPRIDMGVKISGKANGIQAKMFGAHLFTLNQARTEKTCKIDLFAYFCLSLKGFLVLSHPRLKR